jgi:hypothetical protein
MGMRLISRASRGVFASRQAQIQPIAGKIKAFSALRSYRLQELNFN